MCHVDRVCKALSCNLLGALLMRPNKSKIVAHYLTEGDWVSNYSFNLTAFDAGKPQYLADLSYTDSLGKPTLLFKFVYLNYHGQHRSGNCEEQHMLTPSVN